MPAVSGSLAFERAIAHAALRNDDGDRAGAVEVIATTLRTAPPGNAGWLIPVDPLLRVWESRDDWAPVLATLRARAR